MDRFRQIFDYTRAHLSQLSPTQKMLIGSAVIIMAMTLFMVNQYAGDTKMMTLPVSTAEAADAAISLRQAGIKVQSVGSELLVSDADFLPAITMLSQTGGVGGDALQVLLDRIQEQPWWAPNAQNQQAMNAAQSQMLSTIVTGWTYVTKATVVVTSNTRRSMIGQRNSPTTAAASITPKGAGGLTDVQVRGIADFIAGSVASLKPEDVSVHDASTGRSRRVRNEDEMSASNYSELQANTERIKEEKIYGLLQHIAGVVVAVNATMDLESTITYDIDYKSDGKGSLLMPESEETSSIEEINSSNGGVPGVQANTQASVPTGRSGQDTGRTVEDGRTTFDGKAGKKEVQSSDPKGYAKMIRAAINVPRSHYVRIWKIQNPADPNAPADAQIEPAVDDLTEIIAIEEAKITSLVRNVIDPSSGSDSAGTTPTGGGEVAVEMYWDDGQYTGGMNMPSQDAGLGSGLFSFVGGGSMTESVKTVAVSALGLVSLFLMFRLIRGSTTKRSLPTAEELVGIPPNLEAVEDDMIGMAAGMEAALDGVELDEEELRSRNLLEQVQEMVEGSPADAARLLGRWSVDE